MFKDANGFTWDWCTTCDCAFVRCAACGNNCCNGGTGDLPNGKKCGCEVAYYYQKRQYKADVVPTEEQCMQVYE